MPVMYYLDEREEVSNECSQFSVRREAADLMTVLVKVRSSDGVRIGSGVGGPRAIARGSYQVRLWPVVRAEVIPPRTGGRGTGPLSVQLPAVMTPVPLIGTAVPVGPTWGVPDRRCRSGTKSPAWCWWRPGGDLAAVFCPRLPRVAVGTTW